MSVEAIKRAIDEMYSDTTVTPAQTLESLEELQAEIECKIEALKSENNL